MDKLNKAIAKTTLALCGGKVDRVPYPLLGHVIAHLGGWAGVSIYCSLRQFSYEYKINNLKKILVTYILPIFIISVIIIGAFQNSENFFFGFFQNLSAEIILVLLIIYILPRILNPKKKYKISLIYEDSDIDQYEDGKEYITFSLVNTGGEVYRENEVKWEIFIPEEYIDSNDISIINGSIVNSDDIFMPMWKISGINSSPLFIDDKLQIANLIFNIEVLQEPSHSPCKIYYKIMTINGNVPEFQNVTKDFLGTGVTIERYPKVGELVFYERYDPDSQIEKG